jgi:hypothetical protein
LIEGVHLIVTGEGGLVLRTQDIGHRTSDTVYRTHINPPTHSAHTWMIDSTGPKISSSSAGSVLLLCMMTVGPTQNPLGFCLAQPRPSSKSLQPYLLSASSM